MAAMLWRGLLLTGVFLTLAHDAHAENFTTNIISGTSVDLGADKIVGESGSFNYFEINSGGSQTNDDGIIGSRLTATNNAVLITGTNSVWWNDFDLTIGNTGSVNRLTIQNGGRVINALGLIGNDAAAISNKVVVSGSNTLWSNSQTLTIGFDGSFNQLIITNGGRVDNTFASIGRNADAISNFATVAGTNSLWNNTGVLRVGESGPSSRLTIDGGGRVNNTDGQIGRQSTSTNNVVLVTGTNSFWGNSGSLIVGISGGGNSMTIQNGGIVSNVVGHLGFNSSGGTNSVLVTGANTVWFNRDKLVIGNNGGGNFLTISNTGLVRATNVLVGAGSAGNRIDVTGGRLLVSNSTSRASLNVFRGTVTLNGGTVTVDQLFVTNGAPSVFTFRGGTLITRTTVVANAQSFVVGDTSNAATLNLLGGEHSFANGLSISSNAWLTGTGSIIASIADNGTISPGNSAGSLAISGSLTQQSAATLSVELGGYTQGTGHDFVSVSGTAVFNGRLATSLINDFQNVVTNGASFTILTAGSGVAGTFVNVASGSRLTTTDGFGDVLVTYGGTSLVLSDYHDIRDNDSDGLPNWWEQLYFSSATGADPNADPDVDGQNNQFEYVAGLVPTNSTSMFVLRIQPVSGQPTQKRLLFDPVAVGRTYTPEYRTNLLAGVYTNLTSYAGPSTNSSEVTVTDLSATEASKFYRIRISYP